MSKLVVIALISAFWVIFINSEIVKRSETCKENEAHADCGHCGPKTCDDLGTPIPCGGSTTPCTPQCVCLDGHVRNANGTCIPKKECPTCGGDGNATSGCGNHCGRTCSDHEEVNKTCLSGCRYNGCDCLTGFVYHETLKKCILPDDCLRLRDVTGDPRAGSYFAQRVAIAVQRGNAASLLDTLLGTLARGDAMESLFYL